jgi:uncharacterized membrane protein
MKTKTIVKIVLIVISLIILISVCDGWGAIGSALYEGFMTIFFIGFLFVIGMFFAFVIHRIKRSKQEKK